MGASEPVRREVARMPDRSEQQDEWDDPRWRPRVRFPQRLGPIARTRIETAGVAALIAAALSLAVAGLSSGNWDQFLVFPAFGIPDVLFAWFRWRRFRFAARWSTDLRATILLTASTVYLAVSAFSKARLIGVWIAVALGSVASLIWIVRVVRDRRQTAGTL
jgi:hypothetical protein